ncbi:MAG: alpha/beta hydrolase fold protein [Acidimicrobiia bacterium]|nr:alpha/beta hydrolase fold protein [Acidimicrobiia bacterium]
MLNELVTRAVSTVQINSNLSLSVASQGDDSGPTLVLLPGPTDSWRSYQMILDLLPTSIRTIAVSQRGHGDSDKPATGYRVEHFASDVVPLLDALGVDRAVLAGHSGSCLVARRVAVDHPERVAGLLLEASPTTLVGDTRLQRFVESVVLSLDDPIAADFARSFVVDTSSDDMAPEVVDQFVEDLLKVPARVWRETFQGLIQYDDLNQLASIETPVLLIWGDNDRLVGRQMQEDLEARIAHAKLVVYPGAGHTPRWDDPSRFATDTASLVKRVASLKPR